MTMAPGVRVGPVRDRAGGWSRRHGRGLSRHRLQPRPNGCAKVLPEAFASDPERIARFEREAKTLASLNHPYIAQVYGFEKRHALETGSQAGVLVMEFVTGEDLSSAMSRGPMAIDVVLPIGRQIAEALEAAHEQGIVHRDLKPANVKVRPDGSIKVLDFGLAKVIDPATISSVDTLANSPTLTAAGTKVGTLLGTAPYMAPEQARGRPVDKRADIWAFGVMLFEMLTGTRLFVGQTSAEVLAAVMTAPIPWDRLPADSKGSVRALLARCLERDPGVRLRDIGEARIQLHPGFQQAVSAPEIAVEHRSWRRLAGLAAVTASVGALAFAAAWLPRGGERALEPLASR